MQKIPEINNHAQWRDCFRIIVASCVIMDGLYMALDDNNPKKINYNGFPGLWDQVSEYFTVE